MTDKEFDFWEKAFLAAITGLVSQYDATDGYDDRDVDVPLDAKCCEEYADAALAVWRAKRASVEREHVEKVVTNESGN